MSESGRQYRIEQLSIPRLLFGLLRNRFTGVLTVPQASPEPGSRSVWFRGGLPIFTDWRSPSDVLGEILLQKRMVTPAAYEQGLATMAREGGLLGQVLLRAGALDARTLGEALRLQCARKLVPVFALREGVAGVEAGEHGKGQGDELAGQVNVLALIQQGVARHFDEARIRADMGAAFQAPLRPSPVLPRYRPQFGFRAEDDAILAALAAGAAPAQLSVAGVSPRRVAQVLYTLWACRMLSGEESREAAVPRAPPPPAPRARPATGEPPEEPTKIPASMLQAAPASPTDDGGFEGELSELEARVRAGAHAFALLELPLDADRKQVRARWSDLSGRFHPDRLAADGRPQLRARVEAVFAALSEAHSILSNKDQREGLRALLEAGGDPSRAGQDARIVVRNAIEAEMIARDADKLLKAGSFARALEQYERALQLHAGEAEVQAAAAWCRYQIAQRSEAAAAAALATLDAAVAEQPRCARAHHYRGLILLARRDEGGAIAAFKAALAADRHFTDAERQLRAIELRRRPAAHEAGEDPKKKGLRGLFRGRS